MLVQCNVSTLYLAIYPILAIPLPQYVHSYIPPEVVNYSKAWWELIASNPRSHMWRFCSLTNSKLATTTYGKDV